MILFNSSRRRVRKEYKIVLDKLEELLYSDKISIEVKREIRNILLISTMTNFEEANYTTLVEQTENLKRYLELCTKGD